MNVPIEKLLEAIGSLRNILHQNRITLPAVERDLLLQRIRELYESILNVGTEGPPNSSPEKTRTENSALNIPEGEKVSHPVKHENNGDELPPHEKIAFHQDEMSIAGVMQHRKIASMKQAIGVNEKFLFIRELFNNETEAYQRCIDKIDTATSLAEATSILAEYASKYSWDKEGNAYFHFTSLVERRFV